VVVELSLSVACHDAQNPDVAVAHEGLASGAGDGIAIATASGTTSATSSGVKRRKPIIRSALGLGSSGSPHCGQALRYAVAARVKRSRQFGQQAWVMTGSFRRCP